MTERDIERLITMPKRIIEASSKEFKEEYRHLRKDFKLQSIEGNYYFRMFIRRHKEFQENFSIGLDLLPSAERGMPLIRCNGPHYVSEDILRPDPHYAYHIHKPNSDDIEKELRKLSFSEITESFNSYEKALDYFIKRTNIINANEYIDFQKSLFGEL
jgi:hypothetical protein